MPDVCDQVLTRSIVVCARPSIAPGQAGPEQRVDHEIGSLHIRLGQRGDGPRPARGSRRGITRERIARAKRRDGHVTARVGETACGDIAIATIVAGSAEDENTAAALRLDESQGRLRNGRPGMLHQGQTGDVFGGQPVHLRHLGRLEELDGNVGMTPRR